MGKKRLIVIGMLGISIIITLMIAGCSREAKITKLTDINKIEFYSKGRLDKVLVVGKPLKEQNRNDFEKYFSRKLKNRNTDAIPSFEVIADMKGLNTDSIKDAAVKIEAGAVLVTRVMGLDDKSIVIPPRNQVETFVTSKGSFTTMTPFLEGPYVKNYTTVRLETALFETRTEKLIWSASSQIIAPDSVDEAIEDFSRAIVKQLQVDGYVR